LSGADLKGAILGKADLSGASLEGANLNGADLSGALYDTNTHWPKGFDVHNLVGKQKERENRKKSFYTKAVFAVLVILFCLYIIYIVEWA